MTDTIHPMDEQLIQIAKHDTWDGDLISKRQRDILIAHGFVKKIDNGMNRVTDSGLRYLRNNAFVASLEKTNGD